MTWRPPGAAASNILDSDAQALVNTVNCEGVMGKGLALQFKQRYPDMYNAYRRSCERGEVRIGEMHVWFNAYDAKIIINFPTKIEWRRPSQLWYIRRGLLDLRRVIRTHAIRSIAIPPLGCGNGGLDWTMVQAEIHNYLGGRNALAEVRVEIYPPEGTKYIL